jgi:hypothetical protein
MDEIARELIDAVITRMERVGQALEEAALRLRI